MTCADDGSVTIHSRRSGPVPYPHCPQQQQKSSTQRDRGLIGQKALSSATFTKAEKSCGGVGSEDRFATTIIAVR
jgi:hypothetical protein